jgi:hypothetical protein
MKKNMFLAVALATIVAIPSCTRENSNTPDGNGQETYASFTITLPEGSATRALDDNAGTSAEKTVSTIGIYIIDEGDGTLHFAKKAISEFTGPVDNGDDGRVYTSKFGVKTTTGTKTVVVLVNPTDAVHNRLLNIRKNALGSNGFGLASTDFKTGNSPVTSLVMTGANTGVALSTVQDEAAAIDDPEAVTISRNLAKVVVEKVAPAEYEVTGGTLTSFQYTLVAEARDAHLTEQDHPLFYTVPAEIADPAPYTGTYFDNFTGLVAGTGATYASVLENTVGKTSPTGFYTFENGAGTPYAGNTTAVRLKGVYTPDKDKVTVVTGYNAETGVKTLAGTAVATGTSFYLRYNGEYWTETAHAAALDPGKDYTLLAAEFSKKYEDGVGYYTILVQDAEGVKAVKRNYYYLLQVKRVLGPGSPTETEISDPEKPVEDDTYLAVEATVLPWNFQSSAHDIQ